MAAFLQRTMCTSQPCGPRRQLPYGPKCPGSTGSACVVEETTAEVVSVTLDTALVTGAGGSSTGVVTVGTVTVGTETAAGSGLAFAGSCPATGGRVGVVELTGTARG
jgi:hypothetical protein